MRSNAIATNARPLLPGILLRGGRYRLQELLERQDWLSGVFEAVWTGRDAHRAGSQVVIIEVVLPENTSVMTQTILRSATMGLVTVGRHPHIPGLWDAFSDQGRSFFVFEPIEGETLMGRMRLNGRSLPEHEVIECCLQLTDVLEFLSQQSPQLVHGLIRPEHVVLSRNNSQYILTHFSIVLAGGGTQYIAGMERSRLSPYTAPEFNRGVVDVRTDIYSLIATAYHAVTGSVPTGINGSIPQAQRINPSVSSAFDAILAKGLRTVPNQRYQRPSELRQDLLAMRSVSGTLVPGRASNPVYQSSGPTFVSSNGQQTQSPPQRTSDQVAQALPILLNTNDDMEERVHLLPKPEDLPPLKAGNDTMNATILLGLILVVLVVVVIMSQMTL
jgi:serine/threonine protein kinase